MRSLSLYLIWSFAYGLLSFSLLWSLKYEVSHLFPLKCFSSSSKFHHSKKWQQPLGHLNNSRFGLSVDSLIFSTAFKPHPHHLFQNLIHLWLLMLEQQDSMATPTKQFPIQTSHYVLIDILINIVLPLNKWNTHPPPILISNIYSNNFRMDILSLQIMSLTWACLTKPKPSKMESSIELCYQFVSLDLPFFHPSLDLPLPSSNREPIQTLFYFSFFVSSQLVSPFLFCFIVLMF